MHLKFKFNEKKDNKLVRYMEVVQSSLICLQITVQKYVWRHEQKNSLLQINLLSKTGESI